MRTVRSFNFLLIPLQNNLDLTVDNLMPDIKVEIFRKTEEFLSPIKSFRGRRVSRSFSQVEETASMSIVQQIRAFILYNMFPYDKSMWKCFKNPYWYLFNCIGVLPVVGQIWWLFLFLVKDKTDEHQLCEFIIGFKVSQFMSLGLVATLTGVFRYIRCTTAAISTCATGTLTIYHKPSTDSGRWTSPSWMGCILFLASNPSCLGGIFPLALHAT